MSPENEGPNTQSIPEIDLNNTKNKNWLNNMYPTSGQNSEVVVDRHRNGKVQNGTHNGTSNKNGNTTNGYAANGSNGNTNDLNGNARRNSSHIWSPILQTDSALPDPTTMLYSPSNNNEWKDSEEINNLKNGRHIVSSNNEKNGLVHSEKYSEQDPLTGLYSPQIIPKRSNELSDDEEVGFPDADFSSGCGWFGYRPNWARNLDTTNVFVVFFLLAWVLQGMFMTYFVSVITTIEKLFQIKSRTTGLLLSASEMGQICTALLLTYFAGRGHRPRWIACGMVVFAIAAISCSLPHFIFGKDLMQNTLVNGMASSSGGRSNGIALSSKQFLFNSTDFMSSLVGHGLSSKNSESNMNLCLTNRSSTYESSEECEEDVKLEQASHSKITVIVLCIFFVSLVSSGIGQTAVTTLGIPYIDDNVDRSQSAMYLAITIGVRILGPTIGFLLGSFCTRWYVDFTSPGFDATDSRWIGAWWLGPIIIGISMLLGSVAMFSFPRDLRKRHKKGSPLRRSPAKPLEESPKLRDFPKTVRRQLSNDILMFRTASCVFHLLPIAGLTTFLPKYLETQFRLPASDANMIAAFGGILIMGFGIIIAGIVFIKKQPSAKIVSGWIAMTSFVYASGMVILMFVGCNMDDFAGLKLASNQTSVIFEPTCNLNCTCDLEKFSPICGSDGRTYFSSCHAGCSSYEVRGNKTTYSNCDCIPDLPFEEGGAYEATNGYCDTRCKNFVVFLVIFASIVFVHATSEVGSMLLVMRCTDPGDKSMAMGVIQSAIGLFGNVPCPIIYGAVVDSACLVWKTVCGKHGACSLYNVEAFRHNYLGITAGIMFLAFIMDLVVYSKSHRIDLMTERETKEDAECEKPITGSDTTV